MTGNRDEKGFSLVELLVAVSVFTIIIIMVLSIFQNSFMVQKNAIATQEVQEGIRYALEVMSKELRSARPNVVDPSEPFWNECPYPSTLPLQANPGHMDGYNKVYNFDGGDNVLYFRNKEGDCVYYYLNNTDKRIYINKGTVDLPITPDNVEIEDFSIFVQGDFVPDYPRYQENVTFSIKLKSEIEDISNIRIQTSITSRAYQ
jgi:prepilin-type N-terminal cleavage/methylation domain-containing protein